VAVFDPSCIRVLSEATNFDEHPFPEILADSQVADARPRKVGPRKSASEANSTTIPADPVRADMIINGVVEALFASEVSLGCLHRDMSQ